MGDIAVGLQTRESRFSDSNRILILLIAAMMLLGTVLGGVRLVYGGQSVTYLVLTPSMVVANQLGENFEMSVEIINAMNVINAKFTLAYDPTILRVATVIRGSLMPSPPTGSFSFSANAALGSVQISASVPSRTPMNGNGTIGIVTFDVVGTPSLGTGSSVKIAQSTILDRTSVPIVHDVVGALIFWQNAVPDPPVSGRVLDLYTQKGGLGQGVPGGSFVTGELVTLTAAVTFNGEPVQQKLVSFEVHNPQNETIVLRSGTTDSLGITSISFRIPIDPSSYGQWTGIAVVDIGGEIAWDTITFNVSPLIPTGGYSTITAQSPHPSMPLVMSVISIVSIVLREIWHRIRIQL